MQQPGGRTFRRSRSLDWPCCRQLGFNGANWSIAAPTTGCGRRGRLLQIQGVGRRQLRPVRGGRRGAAGLQGRGTRRWRATCGRPAERLSRGARPPHRPPARLGAACCSDSSRVVTWAAHTLRSTLPTQPHSPGVAARGAFLAPRGVLPAASEKDGAQIFISPAGLAMPFSRAPPAAAPSGCAACQIAGGAQWRRSRGLPGGRCNHCATPSHHHVNDRRRLAMV